MCTTSDDAPSIVERIGLVSRTGGVCDRGMVDFVSQYEVKIMISDGCRISIIAHKAHATF